MLSVPARSDIGSQNADPAVMLKRQDMGRVRVIGIPQSGPDTEKVMQKEAPGPRKKGDRHQTQQEPSHENGAATLRRVKSSSDGHALDSYIGSTGIKGYFFLAQDADERWYSAQADDEQSDPYTATFCGPWKSRGHAIISAEDWVAISQI